MLPIFVMKKFQRESKFGMAPMDGGQCTEETQVEQLVLLLQLVSEARTQIGPHTSLLTNSLIRGVTVIKQR